MDKSNPRSGFGLWTLIALVVGNAIGAGLYTTSGFALADLGSRQWVLVAWFVGGLIALSGAISYGMLARQLTESGGEYLYLSRSLHPLAGFIAGWISLLAGFTGAIAFAATTFETYAAAAIPMLATLPPDILAVSAILFGGAIHIIRTGAGAAIHDVIVFIMILALVALLLYAGSGFLTGVWAPTPAGDFTQPFNLTAFAGSLVWISLSYSGFNAAVYVAGEARNAQHNVPRGMIIGTLLTIVLYVGLNAVFLYAPSPSAVAGQPEVAAIAADAIGGQTMRTLIEALVAISLLTSVTAMILAGPRVYAKMAEDGALPSVFTLKENLPPRSAILLQVILAAVVTIITDLQSLLSYLGFTLSLCLALAVSTLFVRHIRNDDRPRHWAYPLAPAVFVTATCVFAALSASRNPTQLAAAVATVAIGVIAYFVSRRRRSK